VHAYIVLRVKVCNEDETIFTKVITAGIFSTHRSDNAGPIHHESTKAFVEVFPDVHIHRLGSDFPQNQGGGPC
jgi:hypothetical protein